MKNVSAAAQMPHQIPPMAIMGAAPPFFQAITPGQHHAYHAFPGMSKYCIKGRYQSVLERENVRFT